MYILLWILSVNFLCSHWEKYNTGIMYLPWGYDFSMITSFLMYLITAATGTSLWKQEIIGGWYPSHLLEIGCYLGNVGFTLPVALYNINQSYKDVSQNSEKKIRISVKNGFCFRELGRTELLWRL